MIWCSVYSHTAQEEHSYKIKCTGHFSCVGCCQLSDLSKTKPSLRKQKPKRQNVEIETYVCTYIAILIQIRENILENNHTIPCKQWNKQLFKSKYKGQRERRTEKERKRGQDKGGGGGGGEKEGEKRKREWRREGKRQKYKKYTR